jgi:hypothetical protein
MLFKPTSAVRITKRGAKEASWDNGDQLLLGLSAVQFVLEIADDCVVCSPSYYRIHYGATEEPKRRRLLSPTLCIYRSKDLQQLFVKSFFDDPMNKDAFGMAEFYRPKQADEEDHSPSLSFTMSLDDDAFDKLYCQIMSGLLPTDVFLELVSPIEYLKENGTKKLEYGWEPDGSRRIWNIAEDAQADFLPIKSVRFTTEVIVEPLVEEESPDSILPTKLQSQSLEEVVAETKKTNEHLMRLSTTLRKLAWVVVLLGTTMVAMAIF